MLKDIKQILFLKISKKLYFKTTVKINKKSEYNKLIKQTFLPKYT
jgi:hypothetical protein